MNVVLWILAAVLAAFFLAAGGMKLAQPKEKLAASPNMAWAHAFSPGALKAIGALEGLAAVGGGSNGGLLVGAAITHARRKEPSAVVTNVVLIALAAVVAWGRFGPYPFA